MSTYDRILRIIGDEWIASESIENMLEDHGVLPHKGTLSRAFKKAMKHELIERRRGCGGMRWQYEYRTAREHYQ